MKRIVLCVAAAALVMTGCGKKVSESVAEKMIESAMAKDGVKGKVNISDGKVTMETKDGTASFSSGAGVKVPDNFPKDVLVYDGAKVIACVNAPGGQNLVLESKDSVEKIIAAYKGKMTGAGWKEEMNMNQADTAMLIYKKDPRTASIVVAHSGDVTQIQLTTAEK